jgi:lipocalin
MWKLLKGILSVFFTQYNNNNNNNNCPPVEPVSNIDLQKFVKHTWYSQMQQEVAFQNKESFYCVTATYNIEKNRIVPFFSGNVISVYNYANYDKVNGVNMNNKNGTVLCAKQIYPYVNSQFSVAPCNVISVFGGPYWIIGVGKNYEWLVVSGGQPKEEYKDGCTTKINATNNSGLWIFSRKQNILKSHMKEAIQLLQKKGYTLSQLKEVEQEGCLYKDAFIK